nr:hypothetical protein [Tanacetum cinerariifolium]
MKQLKEISNEPTQAIRNKFKELYATANELYPGCNYVTRLDFMAKFTYFKVKGKLSDSIFNEMLEGKDHKDKQFCLMCNRSRWKDNNTSGKKVPKKVLRYFLIIPRLQHLYKSSHTTKKMTWHATGKCTEPGKMQHPVDGKAWKNFDTKYLNFTEEPRNVRLGLAADGFNPFENLSQSYNMWPVILTTYNLPPWLCMKESSFMLTLLIHGPKSPGKDIDRYFPTDVTKPIIKLGLFFKQICSQTLMEDDMLKAQSKVVNILFKLELIYPPGFFDIMIYLVTHLLPEALEGGPIRPLKDMKDEFPGWFGSQIHQRHVDKDPGVSANNELFALASGPTPTPISVNSCVVNDVRFVIHIRKNVAQLKTAAFVRLVVEHVNHKKFSNGGVILVEDDPDIIHVYNSSDLALSTSLNDLKITALYIDGQSIDVDAPPDFINVDEDVLPHDDHSSHWANLLGEITQFDLNPHMQFELWPEIKKGIDQHLGKIYTDNKSSLKRDYWCKNPDNETYDMEAIRSLRPANNSAEDWDEQILFYGEIKDEEPPRKFDWDDIMAQLARLPMRVNGKHPIQHQGKTRLEKAEHSKWLVARPKQKREVHEASGFVFFHTRGQKKFCQFIKGVKLPDRFGSNFKHKVTDNDTNITGLKSHDRHIMMQRLLSYGLQRYFPPDVAKPIIKLGLFFKQICSQTLMEDDMLKAQSKVVDILCKLELIYPPGFFDIMIYLVTHLLPEALEGGPIRPRWMYPFERFMKNLKKLFKDMKDEFPGWFGSQIHQRHVDKDPRVSANNELFAVASGPTPTPISVNSCVVNGVRSSDALWFLAQHPGGAKGETQFDLNPHMQFELWPEIRKGIDQHLGKIYMDNKSSLKRDYWGKNPDDETYDMEAIRSLRPANNSAEDWYEQILF